MISLRRDDPMPLYLQVKESLKREILAGRFLADQPIPDERSLADELGLSRMTVRRALVELTEEGLLQRISGRGTFVRRPGAEPTPPELPPMAAPGAAIKVGLVIRGERIDARDGLFYARVLQGMHLECGAGVSLGMRPLLEKHADDLALRLTQEADLSGVIVIGITDRPTLYALLGTGKPTVLYDCAMPSHPAAFDFVTHANEEGGYLAASALLDLGHRDAAFFVHASSDDPRNAVLGEIAADRKAGFERAFRSRGIDLAPERLMPVPPSGRQAYENAARLFRAGPPPTALACTTDEMALGALAAAKDAGLRVPEDISIVGFGEMGYFSSPGLSTVHMELEPSGAAAVRLLRERIARPELPARREVFPVAFVGRESLAAPRTT
ncbi:MAG: GntR family transcriptional regulator [Planctomycetes bacterium]|nr:GntR family transcriptional regulator [Planctomycetota bacterium]